MFLYNTQNWWKYHIQNTIFSSGYILIDLLRLLSIPLAFLAFPSIYIGLGIRITFLIIFCTIIVIGAVIYYLTKDTKTSLQSMILATIFLTIGYIFVILAETLLVLYWTCAISFLILQDWAYRISFKQNNNESLLEYIDNNNHSKLKKTIELVSYLLVIISSFIASSTNWNSQSYENLKKEKISFTNNNSISEQLYNNPFTQKIANSNWENGLEQSESLLGQILDIIQNLKWVQDIVQSLERFKVLVEYLGYAMIAFTILAYILPIIIKWASNIINK